MRPSENFQRNQMKRESFIEELSLIFSKSANFQPSKHLKTKTSPYRLEFGSLDFCQFFVNLGYASTRLRNAASVFRSRCLSFGNMCIPMELYAIATAWCKLRNASVSVMISPIIWWWWRVRDCVHLLWYFYNPQIQSYFEK